MTRIVVLLSAGRHPVNGRPRPAVSDAQALHLANVIPDAQVTGLHAGPIDAAVRPYAGYATCDLIRLDVPADHDPLPAIVGWLQVYPASLILTGSAAEHGPATGLLPYALAERLNVPCIPDVTAVESVAQRVTLVQALDSGRRRRLAAPVPVILTAAKSAPAPTGWAYARTTRARIAVEPAPTSMDPDQSHWRTEPARPLGRPVKKLRGDAAARMAAATSFAAGRGHLMVRPTPEQAARAIADYLQAEGLLRR